MKSVIFLLQRFEAVNLFFAAILLFSAYKVSIRTQSSSHDLNVVSFLCMTAARFVLGPKSSVHYWRFIPIYFECAVTSRVGRWWRRSVRQFYREPLQEIYTCNLYVPISHFTFYDQSFLWCFTPTSLVYLVSATMLSESSIWSGFTFLAATYDGHNFFTVQDGLRKVSSVTCICRWCMCFVYNLSLSVYWNVFIYFLLIALTHCWWIPRIVSAGDTLTSHSRCCGIEWRCFCCKCFFSIMFNEFKKSSFPKHYMHSRKCLTISVDTVD